MIENSDFRKFDDSLRMVLDCTPELAAGIEDYLKAAAAKGGGGYALAAAALKESSLRE